MTPFKALYGRDPPVLLRWIEKALKVEEINRMIHERNTILDELKENLTRAQEWMKYTDKNRRELQFQIGDKVLLKMQPYKFCSLASKPNEKLSPRYYEPYEILEKIGAVA